MLEGQTEGHLRYYLSALRFFFFSAPFHLAPTGEAASATPFCLVVLTTAIALTPTVFYVGRSVHSELSLVDQTLGAEACFATLEVLRRVFA